MKARDLLPKVICGANKKLEDVDTDSEFTPRTIKILVNDVEAIAYQTNETGKTIISMDTITEYEIIQLEALLPLFRRVISGLAGT